MDAEPEKIADVLEILCGERPPMELVQWWIEGKDEMPGYIGPPLQDWVSCRNRIPWAYSITQIEAAENIAGEPRPKAVDPMTGEEIPGEWL